MNQQHEYLVPEQKQRGQSLVEVALFLPILIIIIAGVVEVSQLLVTQNRVTTASRAAARFGANGGENEGIRRVIMNNVTQTLDLNEALWDIWILRGQINEAGDDILNWEFDHIYGISNTVRFGAVDEATLHQRVIDELSVDGRSPADLRFVGTFVQHDVDTILGLSALPGLDGFNSVSSLNVMRIVGEVLEATRGCDAFPIAVKSDNRSISGPPGSQGGNPYPNSNEFWNPNPPTYDSFTLHRDNVELANARTGDLFRIWDGGGPGNFGWLRWNRGINTGSGGSSGTLVNSLSWPGNSKDYHNHGDGGQAVAAGIPHVVRGFVDYHDNTDLSLNIGNWVAAGPGVVNSNAVRNTLADHVARERQLRVIVFDNKEGTGSNVRYQVERFAVFQLHGFDLPGNNGWILAEFIRWDDSCGQQ